MPGITAIQNGRLGGRPRGRKNDKTIERDAARKVYEQMVLENLQPLFQKKLLLGMGQVFVYRKEKHGTGASMRIEHVLLEDPREISDALDTIANNDENWPNEDGFVYVSTKAPDNRAIEDLLDRGIGKTTQNIDHTSGGERFPLPLLDRVPPNNSTKKNRGTK